MNVKLAGMNVDLEALDEALAVECAGRPDSLTPETLSAAYARISRDPRPLAELRRTARREVVQARESNQRIIFGLGHASVAEHAVFNLDVSGISRLAAEFLEHFRLASFTEKSQRYITLDGDAVIPEEVRGTEHEAVFRELVRQQNETYSRLYGVLGEWFPARHPDMARQAAGRRTLDGWAKEDARYAVGLSVETQLGMTVNARALERIILRSAVHPAAEVRELGRRLYGTIGGLAPSVIRYVEPEPYQRDILPALAAEIGWSAAEQAGPSAESRNGIESEPARLLETTADGEAWVFAVLAHENSALSLAQCLTWARQLDPADARRWLDRLLDSMAPYHGLPRAFEYAGARFETVVSAACYAQLKRHRMCTQTVQNYDPELGVTIPPSVEDVGLADDLRRVTDLSADLYRQLARTAPAAAPCALTNAHRRRVLLAVNFRELHHFMRLRLDAHAQWDIRRLARSMADATARRYPLFAPLLAGKDEAAARDDSEPDA